MAEFVNHVHRIQSRTDELWLNACGKARAEAMDRCYWRMLAAGELMTRGWKMAIMEERSTLTYTIRCLAVAPGDPVPKGCRTLMYLPAQASASGRSL